MNDINRHEYALLDQIAQDSLVTQANLSRRLGIAVGSVNWYIKRLVHRGWVKVSRLDRTRLKYDLTAEGMRVFTQRAMMYARDSLKVYSSVREQAKSLVGELVGAGVRSVYLVGDDEFMDILRLTCIEAGMKIDSSPDGCVLQYSDQEYRVRRSKEKAT